MVTLPRRIPRALAMGMLLTGRRIGAAQALEYGLVNEVVPADDLDAAVDAWVEDIVACAPLSLKAIKRSAHDTAHVIVPAARNTRLPSLAAADVGIRVAFSCPVRDRNPWIYGDQRALLPHLLPSDRAAIETTLTDGAPAHHLVDQVEAIAAAHESELFRCSTARLARSGVRTRP